MVACVVPLTLDVSADAGLAVDTKVAATAPTTANRSAVRRYIVTELGVGYRLLAE
jgi:hypothetical protein